jgi:hypothetical protein
MNRRVALLLALAVAALPGALALGGFNGLSLVGAIAAIGAVCLVAISPSRRV